MADVKTQTVYGGTAGGRTHPVLYVITANGVPVSTTDRSGTAERARAWWEKSLADIPAPKPTQVITEIVRRETVTPMEKPARQPRIVDARAEKLAQRVLAGETVDEHFRGMTKQEVLDLRLQVRVIVRAAGRLMRAKQHEDGAGFTLQLKSSEKTS